jgi:RNA polymerase sigma-70 factor (ECF subfamily)
MEQDPNFTHSSRQDSGGAAAAPLFPHTVWSRVHRAGADGNEAQVAMEYLCVIYREPARKYLISLGCHAEDAEDLTQEFMLRWATRETMERLAPETGKLRSYIRQSLRNLWSNARRDATTRRRGGGQAHFSLEDNDLPEIQAADQLLDTEWALSLLRMVMTRLREGYESRGKAAVFDALCNTLFDAEAVQPYARIGVTLGIKESQVKLEVHRLRRRFGESLTAAVATTVADPADVEGELRHILQAASCAELH